MKLFLSFVLAIFAGLGGVAALAYNGGMQWMSSHSMDGLLIGSLAVCFLLLYGTVSSFVTEWVRRSR